MATRTVQFHPLPYNWADVSGAANKPWKSYGPATFIPLSDDRLDTGIAYGWLDDGIRPAAGVLGLNLLSSLNQPGGALANPTLNAGESWLRWRLVVGTALHPNLAINTNNWTMRVRDWATDVFSSASASNMSDLGAGMYATGWVSGAVPALLAIDVTVNQQFVNGAGQPWTGLFAFWGLSVEAEITTPDPVGPPVARFSAALRPDRKTVDVDASSSSPGLNSTLTNYAWDWGDGSPRTPLTRSVTASHTYSVTGSYPVKLTVTNSAGLKGTAVQSLVATVPGTGGQPEIPDPDPTPPPPVTPPVLPETDKQVLWYPQAIEWATECSQWETVDRLGTIAPGTPGDSPTSFAIAGQGAQRGVLHDSNLRSGIRSAQASSKLTLAFPIGQATDRAPLPAGMAYKRLKLRFKVSAEGSDPLAEVHSWTLATEQAGAVQEFPITADAGWWETEWLSLNDALDFAMDAVEIFVTDTGQGAPVFYEVRALAEYGRRGELTLPAIPIDSEDVIYPLYGSLHLSVSPGAAGIPPLTAPLSDASPGTAYPNASSIEADPMALQIDNGVPVAFGYGIGGYGLDVGCMDGAGVEWWLTDVEGWDDGPNIDLTVIDPSLGTGTFVNNARASGREITVSGTLFSTSPSALRSAKRRLAGALAQPPHIGWMQHRGLILPVALAEPIKIDHISNTSVEFEAVFRGVRAPYSMGMGVWREGKYRRFELTANSLVDVPEAGSTPITPIVTVTGPFNAGSRIDAVSPGATYRSGGFVLAQDVPANTYITINSILRSVVFSGTKTPATAFIDWQSSRWMYLDPRGCRLIAEGNGNGRWVVEGRDLW